MKEDWLEAWKDLSQSKIQEWIERIPEHITKIIDYRGGNKYREGLEGRKRNPNKVH